MRREPWPKAEYITVDWVREQIRHLEEIREDDEAAHADEDSLQTIVLSAVASRHKDSADLAAEVLKTRDIQFARWCA